MPIRFVTFDCAQTLLEVDFSLEAIATTAGDAIGLRAPEGSGRIYGARVLVRYDEFLAANLTRDPAVVDRFYRSVSEEWFRELSLPLGQLDRFHEAGDHMLFGQNSRAFQAYPEAVESLSRLRAQGLRLAVISNWDVSLHRVLRHTGLDSFFEVTVASLEEGIEKPEPEIFEITLKRLGASPAEVLHVGDSPEDDIAGATAAGIRSVLIDRTRPAELPHRISRLTEVAEVIEWIG